MTLDALPQLYCRRLSQIKSRVETNNFFSPLQAAAPAASGSRARLHGRRLFAAHHAANLRLLTAPGQLIDRASGEMDRCMSLICERTSLICDLENFHLPPTGIFTNVCNLKLILMIK